MRQIERLCRWRTDHHDNCQRRLDGLYCGFNLWSTCSLMRGIKDGSARSGADAAWTDNFVFVGLRAAYAGLFVRLLFMRLLFMRLLFVRPG